MRLDPLMTASPITGAIRAVTDDLLADVYLVPRSDVTVAEALEGRRAPWSDSFAAAPRETAMVVEAGLETLARAAPGLDPSDVDADALPPGRARVHLVALLDLWRDLGTAPGRLAVWAHVLRSDAAVALEPLPPLAAEPCAFADPAERALQLALAGHHGLAHPAAHEAWQRRQAPHVPTAPGAAGHLQAALGRSSDKARVDGTVAAFGLRDPREEAQFAAARAQALLDAGRVAAPRDIGVLVPDDPACAAALAEAFDRLGLPLSGGPAQGPLRDLAGELLALVLVMLERPAPRTALASLCVLPMMPWPRETGRRMAREIMDRGWSRTASDLDGPGRDLWTALRPVETPAQLVARLSAVAKSVPALDLRPRLRALQTGAERLDWAALHAAAAPRMAPASGRDRFVEGVTYLSASALPWRPVHHLIVTGLMGRRYPGPPAHTPFFTESEIAALNAATPLELPGRLTHVARGLALFRRQLCAATQGLTLLGAARDMAGDALPVSTGYALIAHALGTSPEDLVHDVRGSPPEAWPVAAHRPARVRPGAGPELANDGLLHLGSDLLRLRESDKSRRPRQSPSRLETLLVSPLAWFLDEIDAGDRTWQPERLDVMTLGNLLHRTVELVFVTCTHRPDGAAVQDAVPGALAAAIDRFAPWLTLPIWQAERASLAREAHEVCASWAGFLRETGARVLQNEISLSGDHGGLLLHGKADCLLRLPDGRILVVDHKRSRAAGRRDRMARGWDLQVALYRAMLERPDEATPLTELVGSGADVVTAYHTMLDGTVLTDARGAGLAMVEPVQADVSENAMATLAERVAELGGGTLRLNRADDVMRLKKDAGITAYALEGNAFVAAFTLPEEATE